MIKDMLFGAVGGLGFFLFGMGLMSDGLKKVAGRKLKNLLEALTKHRVIAVLVGAAVTCLIQSSSATTVMAVGFVNAGLLTLKQALCVVLGANIGTTFTAWLVSAFAVFKISSYALPLVAVGFALTLVGKTEKLKSLGQILIGFGILFVGIHFMKEAFAPLKDLEQVHKTLISVGENPLLAVLAGTTITMLLQSSSASIAMVQMLALQGAFGTEWPLVLKVTIPYILGDNIGTTITAQLAALRASRNAKRTAMGHTLFNVIGVVYILLFLEPFTGLVQRLAPWELTQVKIAYFIAFSHTLFNVFNTIVFLPIIKVLEAVVMKILPVTKAEVAQKPVALEEHLLNTPVIALAQTKREIVRMADTAKHALQDAFSALVENKNKKLKSVHDLEDIVDDFQLEITTYLSNLSRRHLSDEVSTELPVLLHTVNDLERIGDHAVNIAEIAGRKISQRLHFSESALIEARRMNEQIGSMFDNVIRALKGNDLNAAKAAIQQEAKVNDMQIEFRRNHVQRMSDGYCTAYVGLIFIDFVDNIEKIGDHLTNISQAIIGGLQWTGLEPRFSESSAERA